jgi:hypothetical protein
MILELPLVFECVFPFLDGKSIHRFLITSRYIMDKCEEYEPTMIITDDIIKNKYDRMIDHIRVGNFKFDVNRVFLYEEVWQSFQILNRINSAREIHIDTNLERYFYENAGAHEMVVACLDHRMTYLKSLNKLVVHTVWDYGEYGPRYLRDFIKKCILVHSKKLNIETLSFIFNFCEWKKVRRLMDDGTAYTVTDYRDEPKIPNISLLFDFAIPSCALKNVNFYFTGDGARTISINFRGIEIFYEGEEYNNVFYMNGITFGCCYTSSEQFDLDYPDLDLVTLNNRGGDDHDSTEEEDDENLPEE